MRLDAELRTPVAAREHEDRAIGEDEPRLRECGGQGRAMGSDDERHEVGRVGAECVGLVEKLRYMYSVHPI